MDAFGQGHCDRNVFDLDFPLWFYAVVSLAGLLLLPWFHVIGCIVFEIISTVASTLNLNWIHGHRPANRTTLDWNSTLNTDNTRHLIKPRNPVHLAHHSVCSEFDYD